MSLLLSCQTNHFIAVITNEYVSAVHYFNQVVLGLLAEVFRNLPLSKPTYLQTNVEIKHGGHNRFSNR